MWVNTLVVDLNLCPFAKRPLAENRVRFSVTEAATEKQLLRALQTELRLLERDSSIETTLLVHPDVLQNFFDYNQFLGYTDQVLQEMKLEGVFQIASFHPDYRFAGTAPDDSENYTNRSPYPVLHLIREQSLERALAEFADADQIPVRNIAVMNSLGQKKLAALVRACVVGSETE